MTAKIVIDLSKPYSISKAKKAQKKLEREGFVYIQTYLISLRKSEMLFVK